MKCLFFVLVILFSVAFVQAIKLDKSVRHVGVEAQCSGGVRYSVKYDTQFIYSDDSFISLEQVQGLDDVICDIDRTRLLLIFKDSNSMNTFLAGIVPYEMFVTSWGKFSGCGESAGSLILRRIISFSTSGLPANQVELVAVPANYDEIIEEGDISVSSIGPCGETAPNQICLGINVDDSCNDAKKPFPIFSDDYVSITCSDCFLGFYVGVFVEIKISGFKLQYLAGGFKDIKLNSGIVTDMNAHYSWSAAVDKNFMLVPQTDILNFHIGVIPIHIWFQIPVEVLAQASFQTSAAATVGALGTIKFGDLYVAWDPKNHWQTITPNPTYSWTPKLDGSAQFSATAQASVAPTVEMHVDNIFTCAVKVTPTLFSNAEGSTVKKQICADLSYELAVDLAADLHIDIAWVHLTDKSWSKTLYDSGVKPIGHTCVPSK